MASRARQLSKLLSSDLLTVDVNNSRIGVNSTSPEETLDVRDSLSVAADTLSVGINSVGIGTESPNTRLHVSNPTPSNVGGMFVQNLLYGNNQDKPYLIVGTSGWTGATTNWNTFGIQHRVKSNSGGVGRVTIDTFNGEAFNVLNNGNIGIGTDNPTNKLHVLGSHTEPQIKIHDSENGNSAQISLDGVNSNFNLDWVSGIQRNINFLNTGYTSIGGQGGIAVGVGTTLPRNQAGVTIVADGGNANEHTAFAIKTYGNLPFLRFTRGGTTATGSMTISHNYERTGSTEWTPDNTSIDRNAIIFDRALGIQFRHSTQDGSATYSSAPGLRMTVDENGVDVNGALSKILVHLEFHTHLLAYLQPMI